MGEDLAGKFLIYKALWPRFRTVSLAPGPRLPALR